MPGRGIFEATVVSNTTLCREHYKLTLRVPGLPESGPGQFVQVMCRDADASEVDHEIDWSRDAKPTIEGDEFTRHDAFLRRPFSIAGRRGEDIDLIGREVGPGTRYLSKLQAGQHVEIIGPLGNRFVLPEPGELALLVGGGVGIPPMIYVAQAISELNKQDGRSNRLAVAFAGALTKELMSLTVETRRGSAPVAWGDVVSTPTHEFYDFGIPSVLTTDDGSLGMKGYVTDALVRFLDSPDRPFADSPTLLYTCGPEPMMKRVQQIAAERGIRCQIAVERAMACGMGTCQSCCIRVRKPDPSKPPLAGKDWCWRLACTDGPVFSGAELLW